MRDGGLPTYIDESEKQRMARRVAMISEHASPLAATGGVDAGGQNVYVAHTARQLASMGHEVDVFTRRDDASLPVVVRPHPGVRVIHVDAGPPRFVPKEALLPAMAPFAERVVAIAAAAEAAGRPYGVAHAHFFMSGLVARRLKEACGVPFVATFHALGRVRLLHQPHDGFPRERGVLEQSVIDDADAVIAECPQDACDLAQHYEVDAQRVTMIPCGFDPREFRSVARDAARRELGLPLDRPVLLQLGRMVPRKGVDDVIRALGILRREHGVDALLVVVGGESDAPDPRATPEIGRLMAVARDAGVVSAVRFEGRRRRDVIHRYYGAADVFVTTPWYEPFGITPVEAMACGVPVVGTRVGGIQYTVQDGRTGFLVDPKDPPGLAHRLAQMLSDPAIPRLFGRRARRRAYQLFTWRTVAEQLDALYARVTSDVDAARRASVLGAVRAL
jgi:glycosyltransferase involved in cell wall biosynthesis